MFCIVLLAGDALFSPRGLFFSVGLYFISIPRDGEGHTKERSRWISAELYYVSTVVF